MEEALRFSQRYHPKTAAQTKATITKGNCGSALKRKEE